MDTEKYQKLKKQMDQGLSPNDEGPYYHHAWWEAYKGSVKGKLGGLVIGTVVGSIVGAVVAGGVVLVAGAGAIGLAGSAAVVGAFAAGGALFGTHEFSSIGKITGAVSAAQDESEIRMKLYEEGKFNELKHDINEIRELVKGNHKEAEAIAKQAEKDESRKAEETKVAETYRTTHYAQLEPDKKNRFIFSKITLIGLVIGAAAGALFAATGSADALLHGLTGSHGALGTIGTFAASMASFGALGASFGINRDLFRRIFDKTDLMTKGIISNDLVKEQQVESGQRLSKGHGKEDDTIVTRNDAKDDKNDKKQAAYEGIAYPESDTYYQDKVLAAAEKALLSFDHTRATPH